MALPRYEAPCSRPGCENIVILGKAGGSLTLNLYRREFPAPVDVEVTNDSICASCTNDLADWWILGKK